MKPSVLIELDRPRNLRWTTNAEIKVEELVGKPIYQIGDGFGKRELRAVLWAGLIHEDPALSLEQVGDLMDLATDEYISAKVTEAINLANGTKKDPNLRALP